MSDTGTTWTRRGGYSRDGVFFPDACFAINSPFVRRAEIDATALAPAGGRRGTSQPDSLVGW